VPQRQDLDVLIWVVHREQAQQGEGVRQAEIGQSQQHGWPSCRSDCQPRVLTGRRHRKQDLTSRDEVFGKRNVLPVVTYMMAALGYVVTDAEWLTVFSY
jgi:hypothetical protein